MDRFGIASVSVLPRWAVTLLVVALAGTDIHAMDSNPVSCLSLSPFRAVSSLQGAPNQAAETLREQVLANLQSQQDSLWVFHAAGACPQDLAVLDVFQKPEDLVATPQGNSLRFRLEWRQIQGTTEFFLPLPAKQLPSAVSVSQQLRAVARQMLARVDVRSTPDSVSFQVVSVSGKHPLRTTPDWFLVPPGPLSMEFRHRDLVRRRDTLLASGGLYEVGIDFTPKRVVLSSGIESSPKKRRTWPAWAAVGVALAGSAWTTYQQEQAQKAYSSLGPDDHPDAFDRKWSDLQDANRLRNICLGVTLVLTGGAGWLEWDSTH